jgi:K+-sensing histidine kinase KdpD
MSISGQKRAARDHQSKFGQLELLFELASALSRAREPHEIYSAAVHGLAQVLAADRAAVLIFDPDDVLRFKEWVGLSEEYRAAVEGHTPWKRGSVEAQPIAVSDAMQDASISTYRQVHAKEGIRAVAFIPMMGSGGLIGKFVLYYSAQHEFQTDELQFTQTIATHVAFAAEWQSADVARRQSAGLGLSVTHGIVRSHGGAIHGSVSSHGTTFQVRLPCAEKTIEEHSKPIASVGVEKGASSGYRPGGRG